MKRFTLWFHRRAAKQLLSTHQPFRRRIEQAVDGLLFNPYPQGCRKLQGHDDQWRIRVGNYRVIYRVDAVVRIVEIHEIGHRQSVYKN